jgi:hypothetical protein
MSQIDKSLRIPHAAEEDLHAVEMLRAWVANGELHCALQVGTWHQDGKLDECVGWGVLLADIARRVAVAAEPVTGRNCQESLRIIADTIRSDLQRG